MGTEKSRVVNNEEVQYDDPERWVDVAKLRWGKYLSKFEIEAINEGLSLAGPEAKTAIDIGAGMGRLTSILSSRGLDVTTTDVCPDAVTQCQKAIPNANCILVSPEEQSLPVESNSIDIAISIEVELCESEWFIPELNRVLKDSGVAVFTLNNLDSYRAQITNFKSKVKGDELYYNRSFLQVKEQLLEEGFEIVKSSGFAWFPFGRFSNSPLIPLLTPLENVFKLEKLPRWSPWVAIVCQRSVR